MARRRNEETIAAVQNAARDIMLDQGYEAASYTTIAERTGIARTTVQHYFPRKEAFATGLMLRIEEVAHDRALQMAPEDEPPLVSYYLTSQIVYGIFYLTEGARKFLLDISTSRDLQHAAAPDYISEALDIFELNKVDDQARFDLQYENGGIYEMHYLFLKEGKTPELSRLSRDFMHVLARLTGMTQKEYERMVDRYSLSNETLFEIGAELIPAI